MGDGGGVGPSESNGREAEEDENPKSSCSWPRRFPGTQTFGICTKTRCCEDEAFGVRCLENVVDGRGWMIHPRDHDQTYPHPHGMTDEMWYKYQENMEARDEIQWPDEYAADIEMWDKLHREEFVCRPLAEDTVCLTKGWVGGGRVREAILFEPCATRQVLDSHFEPHFLPH